MLNNRILYILANLVILLQCLIGLADEVPVSISPVSVNSIFHDISRLDDQSCKIFILTQLGLLCIQTDSVEQAVGIAHAIDELQPPSNNTLVLDMMKTMKKPTQIADGEKIAKDFPLLCDHALLELVRTQSKEGLAKEQLRAISQRISQGSPDRIGAEAILAAAETNNYIRTRLFSKLIDMATADGMLPSSRNEALLYVAWGQAIANDTADSIDTCFMMNERLFPSRGYALVSVLDVANADLATIEAVIIKFSGSQLRLNLVGGDQLLGRLVEHFLAKERFADAKLAFEKYGGSDVAAVDLATYQCLHNDTNGALQWIKSSQFHEVDVAINVSANCHKMQNDIAAGIFLSTAREIAFTLRGADRNDAYCKIGKCELELGSIPSAERSLANVFENGPGRWELLTEIVKAKNAIDPKATNTWVDSLKIPQDKLVARASLMQRADFLK